MGEREGLRCLHRGMERFELLDIAGFRAEIALARAEAGENSRLRGEILLAESLLEMQRPEIMCEKLRAARALLDGHSRLLKHQCEMLLAPFSPLALMNPVPGTAEANAKWVDAAEKIYFSLTGGGQGMAACYRAQLNLYRGRMDEARREATNAMEAARRGAQGMIFLCAADVLALVAKQKCDVSLWKYAYSHLQSAAEGRGHYSAACVEQAQIICAMLSMSLGLTPPLPDWIESGEIPATSAPWGYRMREKFPHFSSIPNLLMARMEQRLYGGNAVSALLQLDILQKVYGVRNVLTDAYGEFLRAGCYNLLKDEVSLRASLKRGLELIQADGFSMIAAEFYSSFGETLIQEAGPLAEEIRALGEGYWDKLAILREEIMKDAPQGLTPRETEIAALIGEGKTNSEIAALLSLSEKTVENHAANVFGKLNIRRRIHVARATKSLSRPEMALWAKPAEEKFSVKKSKK